MLDYDEDDGDPADIVVRIRRLLENQSPSPDEAGYLEVLQDAEATIETLRSRLVCLEASIRYHEANVGYS